MPLESTGIRICQGPQRIWSCCTSRLVSDLQTQRNVRAWTKRHTPNIKMVTRLPAPAAFVVASDRDLVPVSAAPNSSRVCEMGAIARAHILHNQLAAAVDLASKSRSRQLRQADFMGTESPYMQKLARFYRENLGLARLLDASDLLMQAEGPGALHDAPRLSTVNWLCTTAERRLGGMVKALLPMLKKPDVASRQLDLRLTGLAPGGLYVGFALEAAAVAGGKQLDIDANGLAETLGWLRTSMHALPVVPHFVGTNSLDKQIVEALPDPALRDAAIVAAYSLAPTGQRGVHTVTISAPRAQDVQARTPHTLGQPERVVLREAVRAAPLMRRERKGTFSGYLRAIDLDTGRIVVRGISDEVPALRAALSGDTAIAKRLLGSRVKVTGLYEEDEQGRPRLMTVRTLEALERPLIQDD